MNAPPFAALPMYAWPELTDANDRLWQGVAARCRAAGIAVPEALDRELPYKDTWTHPGLVLGHTCGYPYIKSLRGKVTLVGAPLYDAPGCDGPTYRSMIIVRRDDPATAIASLKGRRGIINGLDSQSGYSALRAVIAPFAGGGRFFSEVVPSGGHRKSILAVAEGRGDVAAIDAICWALAQRYEPAACAGLRVLALSQAAPSLPFITARTRSAQERAIVLDALRQAIAAEAAFFRKELLLVDVEAVEDKAYDRIVEIESEAQRLGYPDVV
jgi:ABC-type phosphate/phosphonate transport system substrate-binding protein